MYLLSVWKWVPANWYTSRVGEKCGKVTPEEHEDEGTKHCGAGQQCDACNRCGMLCGCSKLSDHSIVAECGKGEHKGNHNLAGMPQKAAILEDIHQSVALLLRSVCHKCKVAYDAKKGCGADVGERTHLWGWFLVGATYWVIREVGLFSSYRVQLEIEQPEDIRAGLSDDILLCSSSAWRCCWLASIAGCLGTTHVLAVDTGFAATARCLLVVSSTFCV